MKIAILGAGAFGTALVRAREAQRRLVKNKVYRALCPIEISSAFITVCPKGYSNDSCNEGVAHE